jgi:hypothetical protein
MKTKKTDYLKLAIMTDKPVNFNLQIPSFNALVTFYSKAMGVNLGEPYKNMEAKRIASILAKAIISKKLEPSMESKAIDMIKRIGY